MRLPQIVLVFAVMLMLVACSVSSSQKGIENLWRADDAPEFEPGATTRADVLTAFGPPSQVIPHDGGLIFYYLLEERESLNVILVLFNISSQTFRYDRAIFFFDTAGVLMEYSYSTEAIPPEKAL